MVRLSAGLRTIRILIVAPLLLCSADVSGWAAATKEEICEARADYALALENYPAAITLHRNLLRLHRENALAHYHLGFAYGMTGRAREEINEYLEATRLGLDKWDLFLNLGLAYLGQKEFLKAISVLETAVLLGPDHPEVHFNLAIAYERDNRLREALREITASLRLAPEDPDEHHTKRIICAEMKDLVCAQ
jgi:tetratricopeptide (TPR) repeat protein